MRLMCGRKISAFYNGGPHKGVILGLAPRSLYHERQWRIKFEDRSRESTCSALELTRWLLPPPDENLPKGMCQFIGRGVEIIKEQSRLKGKVVSVLPPNKWLVNFEDGSSTTCYAQELLLWMRPTATRNIKPARSCKSKKGSADSAIPTSQRTTNKTIC